ncbi:MAG: large subunit ribosomal protein L13, partial [Cyclobacteriaceae bacterium]
MMGLGNMRPPEILVEPGVFFQHNGLPMKTISAKKETATHSWYVVDATDKTLGRMATEIANRLRGKHKAEFTPHVDTGDYIVVVNAEKV